MYPDISFQQRLQKKTFVSCTLFLQEEHLVMCSTARRPYAVDCCTAVQRLDLGFKERYIILDSKGSTATVCLTWHSSVMLRTGSMAQTPELGGSQGFIHLACSESNASYFFFSMETTTDTRITTVFDTANSQLQNVTFQYSHHL